MVVVKPDFVQSMYATAEIEGITPQVMLYEDGIVLIVKSIEELEKNMLAIECAIESKGFLNKHNEYRVHELQFS